MTDPSVYTDSRWAAREAREECARVVEAATHIGSAEDRKRFAALILALNDNARPWALSLVDTDVNRNALVQEEIG